VGAAGSFGYGNPETDGLRPVPPGG
jgi:hypothetical protein